MAWATQSQVSAMNDKRVGYWKRRFKPLFSLCTWWKSRRFQYLEHVNAPEGFAAKKFEERTEEEPKFDASAVGDLIKPFANYLDANITTATSESYRKTPHVNSLDDSIISLDSVVDSQCSHYSDDQTSESESFVDKFLMEHLDFLSQSTQPQEVELVYDTH